MALPAGGEEQPQLAAARRRWAELMELAEQDLEQQILLLEEMLASGVYLRLPDGGVEVRERLANIRDELHQRRSIYRRKGAAMDNEKCKNDDGIYVIDANEAREFKNKQETGGVAAERKRLPEKRLPNDTSPRETPVGLAGEFTREESGPVYVSSDTADSSNGKYRDENSSSATGKREADLLLRRSMRVALKKIRTSFMDEAQEETPSHSVDISNHQGKTVHFPSKDDPHSVELFYEDLKSLEGKSYLSSSIMNFYIKYIQRAAFTNGLKDDYHFFNTFFYHKLEEAMSLKEGDEELYIKLRRWWKDVNIFQKAYIFVPVYGVMHWSLVIICIPAQVENSGPVILHLDSLTIHNSGIVMNVIKKFLIDEWRFLNANGAPSNLPISEDIWNNLPTKIVTRTIKVPQQKNSYDCGLFVLYFMERFLKSAPERMTKKDISIFGTNWFQPQEASALREHLQKLLLELFEGTEDALSTSIAGHNSAAADTEMK